MMYVEFNNGDCELLTTLRKRRIWDNEKNIAYHGIVVNETHIVAAYHCDESRDQVWRLWRELLADARFCGLQEEFYMFPDGHVAEKQRQRCMELMDHGEILED